MKVPNPSVVAVALLTVYSSWAGPVAAQDEELEVVGERIDPVIPDEWQDQAFDQYADVALVRDAWLRLEPALLADVGLQLAEGERILSRSHRAISADTVLRVAAKVAARKRDEATLKRLATAAKSLGKKELAAAVSAALQLASAPRALQPTLSVSLDKISPDVLFDYKETLELVESARVRGDRATLDELADDLAEADEWPAKLQTHLAGVVAAAREATSENSDADTVALEKLRAASRAMYIFKLRSYKSSNSKIKIYGSSVFGFPDVCLTPAPPAPPIPIPYPSLKMPIRVKKSNGNWSSKKYINWKSGTIKIPAP